MTTGTLPDTIEATVRLVLALMPQEEQARIATLTRDELVSLHFGLGLWMRNHLGLWNSNQALLDATEQNHPDDASEVLVVALWQHLQDQRPQLH